jgi:hypothetical protein
MNTTEHIVEQYYRLKGYFTNVDIKVIGGNNRQFDILAFHPSQKENKILHIEISIAHGENWPQTLDSLKKQVGKKFFGIPSPSDKKTSDFQKGKNYYDQIKKTYEKYGLDTSEIIRVWCTWFMNDLTIESKKQWQEELAEEFKLKSNNFEILLFRDEVIPYMMENVGKSNYEDEVLRIFSLLKEYQAQRK